MQTPTNDAKTAPALNARGIRFTDSGRYAEAIAAFDEALSIAPDMAGVLFNRAEAKRLSGDSTGARADLLKARGLEPGEADFVHALGLLAYEEDDFEAAAGLYGEALAMDPGLAQAWNDLGVVRFRQSAFREARDCFEKATAIDKDFSEAWFNLADTYDELGMKAQRAAALEALARADKLRAYRDESRE
jgi:tetratricopeptide (TPR) repeat protein